MLTVVFAININFMLQQHWDYIDTPMTWWLELSISHRFSASWRQSEGSKSLTRPIQPPQNGFTTLIIWNGKPKWFDSGMVIFKYIIDFWTTFIQCYSHLLCCVSPCQWETAPCWHYVILPLSILYFSFSVSSISSSQYFVFLLLSILYFFLFSVLCISLLVGDCS